MPVIIDEIVIAVEVTNHGSGGSVAPPTAAEERQAIVAECVERILDVLRQKGER